ncbi:MAG: hypothetical protein ACRCX8_14885 [Sarcina sp.]
MNAFEANGIGRYCGGKYEDVNINGIVKIQDDIIAQKMTCNGIAKVNGLVKIANLDIAGILKQSGNLEVENLRVNGKINTMGNIKFNNLYGVGEVNATVNVVADIVRFNGNLSCGGDFTASEFNVKGGVKNIKGLLNSEIIDIEFMYGGYINEIGGSIVKIKKNRNTKFFNSLKSKILKINTIDADEINLEFSEVKTINGHNVIIGEGCFVEKVEYTGVLEISPTSKVKNIINLNKEGV